MKFLCRHIQVEKRHIQQPLVAQMFVELAGHARIMNVLLQLVRVCAKAMALREISAKLLDVVYIQML